MVSARHFLLPSPSPLPSPSLPTGLSLVCRLVVVLTPPPLPLSTLPPPQPLPMAPLFPFASVCWLVVVSPLVAPPPPCITICVAQPPLASILYRPSLFTLSGCHVESRCTAWASQCAAGSHIASCGTSASHPRGLPSLAPPFSLPPLSMPQPSVASSNAWHTLPWAALPTSTAPLAWVLSSDTSACATASFSLLSPTRTRGGYNKIKQ